MDQPNILLVILDSVRGRNIGHLGYPRDTSPNIDEFAKQFTYYTNARSPGIHSMPSHVSLFSGYHVAAHRATSHGSNLASGHTIWEFLDEKGYQTGLFTSNAIVAEASNLASFFHDVAGPKRRRLVFSDALGPEDMSGKPSTTEYLKESLHSESPIKAIINGIDRKFRTLKSSHHPEKEHGGKYIDEFFDWQESIDGSWAACINLMDSHYPYIPQDEYSIWADKSLKKLHQQAIGDPLSEQYLGERPFWELEAFENLYDCCIRQADDYVHDLINRLKRKDEFENTLIVVTSDHGEGFGEYSVVSEEVRLIDHSWGIGDLLSHVPLVVKYPDRSTRLKIEEPASLTQFPKVVKGVLQDEIESFVPDTGYAITTSYRIQEPGNELQLTESEREPYFGPWHAVCSHQEGQVIVDAVRRDDHVRYESGPKKIRKDVGGDGFNKIKSIVDGIAELDVTSDETDLDQEVKQRLHELGYVS